MPNQFYYEDGQDNVYNEQGVKIFDPMEDVLTQIKDPNIVLESLTTQKLYLSTPRPSVSKSLVKKETAEPAANKSKSPAAQHTEYSDNTRETFIDRMLESPEERGKATRFA